MENMYQPPESNLVMHSDIASASSADKLAIYKLAESQVNLLRVGSIALFAHLFPPLLLLVSVFSFAFTYSLSSKLINRYISFVVALFAMLPMFGLVVISMTTTKSQKRLDRFGFKVTHNKESLEPVKLWLDQ